MSVLATFKRGSNFAVAAGLWQHSYGQKLIIQGLELPVAIEVHFSFDANNGDSETEIGITKDGITTVAIPEQFLENDITGTTYEIYAFIYMSNIEEGETIKRVTMPVKCRPKIHIPIETENDRKLFREAIVSVNKSSEDAINAATSSEAWAHGHTDYPERDKDNAKYYAGQARNTAENIKSDVQGLVDQANAARNAAIENANIATNKADETEADKQSTEANKAATEADKAATASNLAESNRILQEQIQLLGTVPMIYAVTTLEELQAFTGAKDGDFGIIQEPRAMLFRYYTTGADGQPLSQPAWQWMTDLNITFTKESLLSILTLPTVATSGKYADLLEIPNRYNSPIVLDGTGDTITWDYTQSDTALVTLTEDKPLTITGDYNGCLATLDVYGAKLILDDAVYLKSATFPYLEAIEGEHYHYEFQRIVDKWQVGIMVVAGASAEGSETA